MAGAGHVLRNDRRIAGDMLSDMTGDEASIDVVAAAHLPADHQLDALAAVEAREIVGRAAAGEAGKLQQGETCADGSTDEPIDHGSAPMVLYQR
jgi:hypothetical protein